VIFLTVGTHTSGFNRLVDAIDVWAAGHDEPVVAQIGSSTSEPAHCRWFRFASPAEIGRLIDEARVVVSHAGAGSLLGAIQSGRPVIAVPRRAKHGEVADDHQLELCDALRDAGLVQSALDLADLGAMLDAGRPTPIVSDAPRAAIVAAVRLTLGDWAAARR
jgi:UDP-N-acetylglucosamine transferase subunit ALG13